MKKLLLFLLCINICIPKVQASVSSASEYVLMDMDSGRVLASKNKDSPRLIASITKIMTAVIAIENKDLNEVVTIGDEVLKMYGTNIYIEPNEQMTLRDLLYGLMLRSGNDAAVAIANYVSDSEEDFVYLMNKKAKELGMNNTEFKNPHGLDEETQNYSTAYDMAKLMKYANTLVEFVEISGTNKWSTKSNIKSYVWYNRNKLLNDYKYLTGGKTGYTPKAGKTLVTTASKDNLNLVAVSLNDSNHYETHKELYEYIFSKYKSVKLIDKNNIDFNSSKYDNLYINYSFSYPLTDEEIDDIIINVDYYNLDNVDNNSIVGEIYVNFKDEEIFRENIYLREKKSKEMNLFSKVVDFFTSII